LCYNTNMDVDIEKLQERYPDLPADHHPDDTAHPIALRVHHIEAQVVRSIRQGVYSRMALIDEHCDDLYTPDDLDKTIARAYEDLTTNEVIDPRIEVLGYLVSSADLQSTIYEMMESERCLGKTKNVIELMRLLKTFKDDRIKFLRELNIIKPTTASDNNNDAQAEPVDLKKMLEAQIAITVEFGSEEYTPGVVEEEQSTVHTTGNIS